MTPLRKAIEVVGGAGKAAEICGVSSRAVYKWLSAESLPRTEYTGETNHAQRLAAASDGAFTAEDLLRSSVPVAAPVNPGQEQQPKPEGFVDRRRPAAQSHVGIRTGRRATDATTREKIIALAAAKRGEFPE